MLKRTLLIVFWDQAVLGIKPRSTSGKACALAHSVSCPSFQSRFYLDKTETLRSLLFSTKGKDLLPDREWKEVGREWVEVGGHSDQSLYKNFGPREAHTHIKSCTARVYTASKISAAAIKK